MKFHYENEARCLITPFLQLLKHWKYLKQVFNWMNLNKLKNQINLEIKNSG